MNGSEGKSRQLASFVERLRLHTALPDAEAEALITLPFRLLTRDRHSYLMRQGDELRHCTILLSGFVERHRIGLNGRKQILCFYFPGDPLNLENLYTMRSDDALQALKLSEVAIIQCDDLLSLMQDRPAIMKAIVRSLLIDASISREWIFNVGQRSAKTRIAHLICELGFRKTLQPHHSGGVTLPLTQVQIAEATGLTSVHVNRTLKELQSEKILSYKSGVFTVYDIDALAELADFSPSYFHWFRHNGDGVV
ncbi:Crp/Fnr family transcriptional regulator [Flavisphingomonas formosensis]|uniref:Crp/Fnr family transcriptional regulator n=1 Tax=Flavisphingomonas formosensis TaxID=861534 RepID=UPI0018DF2F80|nr:Crp/Fnr family transcriptional regulator [Sphingomonas formosensis]